jgi:putative Mg2+ transporter-C (MgtC) family protein
MLLFTNDGQTTKQLLELGVAFVLSALVGLEREVRRKSAGLRTYTIIGTTAALFLLISKYGFDDVLSPGRIMLDPSRVAAQIVTGIGFMGAGLIFVRENRVSGLTTAATVWLVTAVGMACGAGLLLLAVTVTALYFVVALGFSRIIHLLPKTHSSAKQPDNPEGD